MKKKEIALLAALLAIGFVTFAISLGMLISEAPKMIGTFAAQTQSAYEAHRGKQ